MPVGADNRIEMRGITLRYPPRTLFDRFDADLTPGLTALLGPSGSGKSTLLAIIAGFETPDAGTVHIPDRFQHPTGVGPGWIMQAANVLANRTAIDNVALPLLALGHPLTSARLRARAALVVVGLATSTDKIAGHLSGGERQRVAVARTLAADAPLVLADEPTASLGDEHRRLIVEHLATIAARDRIVAIATHDPWVADQCTAVIDLRNG